MSNDRIEDLEQPDAEDVKGGIGVNVRANDRTVAGADATAQGVSLQAGDTSAAVSATSQDGETTVAVDTN